MTTWREAFGFGDEDVFFDDVHQRYRHRMTSSMLEIADVRRLTEALEAARKELATSRKKPAD